MALYLYRQWMRLCDVYRRSAETYLKRRNRLLLTPYTINGKITYRYKAAGPQQNVPKCTNIPTRGSSAFKPGLVTKYEARTRHKAGDYWKWRSLFKYLTLNYKTAPGKLAFLHPRKSVSLSISPPPTQSSLKCLIHTDSIGLSLEKTAVSSASVAAEDHLSGHITLRQLQFLSYTCSSVIRRRVLRLGVSVRTDSCKPQDLAFIKTS
jgi:hypothetical protein